MEQKFELPKKWCVEITPGNFELLKKWRSTLPRPAGTLIAKHGYITYNTESSPTNFNGHWSSIKEPDFQKITFEQFKKYVLKEEEFKIGDIVFSEFPNIYCNEFKNSPIRGLIGEIVQIDRNDLLDSVKIEPKKGLYTFTDAAIWCYNSERSKLTIRKPTQEELDFYNFKKKQQMKTQSITIQNLKEIHNIACSEWKTKLSNKVKNLLKEDPFEENITFTQDEVKEMFKAATKEQLPIVEKFFENPLGNRKIKNYDDVLNLTNGSSSLANIAAKALVKAALIAEAYNNGDKLDWSNFNQLKYIPYKDVSGSRLRVSCRCYYCDAFAELYFVREEDAKDAISKFPDVYNDLFGV